MLIPPYRILPSACLYVACQLFYCHQSSPPLVRTSEWARDPGPPGLLWPRPPARFRPTSGPPVPVGRPPDPGNPVPPLARPSPGRPQAPGAPAVPPARLSAYRQASARPVVFRPQTRQTPARHHPPWLHPLRRIIQADLRVSPSTPVPPAAAHHPPSEAGHRVHQWQPAYPVSTRQTPALPAFPRGPRPVLPHLHQRAPPTPWPAPAHLMGLRHRPPPGTRLLP
jgi:hypothetical protein